MYSLCYCCIPMFNLCALYPLHLWFGILRWWFRHHLKALRKKLSTQVAPLRLLAGSQWGAGAKTLRISALSLVYSTAEYCAPVWCCSTHTRLIDNILKDALRIFTECLRPTPTEDLPILTGIQPAELRRLGATLPMANLAFHDPDHVPYCTDS